MNGIIQPEAADGHPHVNVNFNQGEPIQKKIIFHNVKSRTISKFRRNLYQQQNVVLERFNEYVTVLQANKQTSHPFNLTGIHANK